MFVSSLGKYSPASIICIRQILPIGYVTNRLKYSYLKTLKCGDWFASMARTTFSSISALLPAITGCAILTTQDLKPSNILVTEDNHVSLIDFGLARQLRALDAEAPTEDKKDPAKSTTAMARKLTQHVVGSRFCTLKSCKNACRRIPLLPSRVPILYLPNLLL